MDVQDLCARLAEAGFLHRAARNGTGLRRAYPADTVSLRSVTSDNFMIIDITGAPNGHRRGRFFQRADDGASKSDLHSRGQQYHVEHLDFKQRKAYVKRVNVDYYTDAIRYTQVRMLECAEETRVGEARSTIPAMRVTRRRTSEIASHRIQEDQVFYQRKYWRGKSGIAGKRDAHDVLLDHAGAASAGVVGFFDQRASERNVWIASRAGIRRHAVAYVRQA